MTDIKWPLLVIEQDDFPLIGVPSLELDGVPFPFPTVGDWRVEFGPDGLATLTVGIPVRLRVDQAEPKP